MEQPRSNAKERAPGSPAPAQVRSGLGSAPGADAVVVMHRAHLVMMVMMPRTRLGQARRDGEKRGGDQRALDDLFHYRVPLGVPETPWPNGDV